MNHIIEELFKYSNDLIQEEREKIGKDLANEIKKVENDLEAKGKLNSGL
jgi:hypothetical protein